MTTQPPIYYITSTSRPDINDKEEVPPWNMDYDDEHKIIVHHAPPTSQPFPTVATHKPQVIYENYNPKYNTYDSEPKPKSPANNEGDE